MNSVNQEIKYQKLIQYLKKFKKAVVAFSGGVDSTFLLAAAKEALGDQVTAVTIQSPYIPDWEVEEAKECTKYLGVHHQIIPAEILEEIRYNPEDRCYLCKRAVFQKIIDYGKEQGINYVFDGTNTDDLSDYRPGLKALKELKVVSPLKECGFNKADIRSHSKRLALETWKKPAYACLLTRIPYGTELDEEELKRIEKAELFLMEKGFRSVRVRSHGELARIELPKNERESFTKEAIMDETVKTFKELGYRFVTLDLEGYKMGSFNQDLGDKEASNE
ncbi:MAG TPA: ATP-dependent sacrificial sulfur transferase LarE [Eubacteriaceae bacterium]|nr:ATP-dependent sacrificial sulfur transferase LarE [Eubacteriaceae bacterium]